jgi:hypothetical protein
VIMPGIADPALELAATYRGSTSMMQGRLPRYLLHTARLGVVCAPTAVACDQAAQRGVGRVSWSPLMLGVGRPSQAARASCVSCPACPAGFHPALYHSTGGSRRIGGSSGCSGCVSGQCLGTVRIVYLSLTSPKSWRRRGPPDPSDPPERPSAPRAQGVSWREMATRCRPPACCRRAPGGSPQNNEVVVLRHDAAGERRNLLTGRRSDRASEVPWRRP